MFEFVAGKILLSPNHCSPHFSRRALSEGWKRLRAASAGLPVREEDNCTPIDVLIDLLCSAVERNEIE